jgi:hypothetical protein
MKKDVSLLFLITWITFSILLLSMVGCVLPYMVESDENARQIGKAAYDDAHDDANVDRCMWLSGGLCLGFGGGCLLGPLGIVAAHFYEPSPPPTRLLGKPPEYVDFYVSNYREVRQNVALSAASIGCIAGAVTAGCLVTPWATVLGTFAGRIADGRGW